MKSHDEDGLPPELADALRRSAARPLRTTAAEAAARVRPLLQRRRRTGNGWTAAAIAALLVVAAVMHRVPRRETPASPPTAAPPVMAVEPLPDNVVLWWVDPETPVYFVVAPAATNGGPS